MAKHVVVEAVFLIIIIVDWKKQMLITSFNGKSRFRRKPMLNRRGILISEILGK
jgi:hypothetical protein